MNSHRPGVVITRQQQQQQQQRSSFSPTSQPPPMRSVSPYSRSNSSSSSHNSKSPASPYIFPDPNVSAIYPGQKKSHIGGGSAPSTYNNHKPLPPPPSSIDRRLSSSPQPQRFTPKHEPVGFHGANGSVTHNNHNTTANNHDNGELSPLEDGALQFVPAFEEAAADGARAKGGGIVVLSLEDEKVGTSWDDIVEEKKEMVPDVARKPATVANVGFNKPRKPSWQSQQSRKADDAATSVSAPLNNNTINSKGSSRISSRIASLFSSRAVVRADGTAHGIDLAAAPLTITTSARRRSTGATAPTPPSPAHSSSSSSGYVGWPGTQDKRGATVAAVQSSSYDDSSVHAPASSSAASSLHPHNAKVFERELQAAAEREMEGWNTNNNDNNTAVSHNSNNNNYKNDGTSTRSCLPSSLGGGGRDRDTTQGHVNTTPSRRFKPTARACSSQRNNDTEQQSGPPLPRRLMFNSNTTSAPAAINDENMEQDPNRLDEHLDELATSLMNLPSSAGAAAAPKQCLSLSSMRHASKQSRSEAAAAACFFNHSWNGAPGSEERHLLNDEAEPSATLSFHNLFQAGEDVVAGDSTHVWENNSDSNVSNSTGRTGSSYSKTSSAYLQVKDVSQLSYPDLNKKREYNSNCFPRRSEAIVIAPTADVLAAKDHYTPPHRSFPIAKGYRGFIEKTKEVPSLMDAVDESESVTSSSSKPTTTTSSTAPSSIALSAIGPHPVTRNFRTMSESGRFDNNNSSRPRRCQPYRHQVKQQDTTTEATRNHSYRSATNIVPDEESDVFDGISLSKESDVFDNLSNFDGRSLTTSPRKTASSSRMSRVSYPERIAEEGDDQEQDLVHDDSNDGNGNDNSNFKLVVLPGGLTAIQSTPSGFSNRKTASDYDENLTNSDIDQYGFTKTPGFNEMLSAGMSRDNSLLGIDGNIGKRKQNTYRSPAGTPATADLASEEITTSESGSSLFSDPYRFDDDHHSIEGDLSQYYIPQSQMKKVLRMYRKLSDTINEDMTLEEFEKEEDEHKAFALFEMRSRIMEKDIERGLERRGGTVPVDDIVTTPYFRTAYRIRDAVIVSKAWRDGASPKDVINTALLTRRDERTYFIKRPVRADMSNMSDTLSTFSGFSVASPRSFWWEPATWVDDTDFMLHRCPSLGPRNMRGSEMFTVGDCQSMLLKLTNEQCVNLRRELNIATRRQIEAEYLLTDEVDASDSMMTEAEMAYLSAMEEVKEISKKLVCAEQSFALVRDRIQKLVSRYEHLLAKIDTESCAGVSSVVTYESSCYSDVESELWEEREKAIWARRAQRAEVKAELAAREALLAKQEVRMLQEEKQRELEALHQKLLELQSEPSYHAVEREHSVALAKSFAMHRHDESSPVTAQRMNEGGSDKQKLDDVKKRFRDRMAARKQNSTPTAQTSPRHQYHSAVATGMFGQPYQSPQKVTASLPSSSPYSMRNIVRSAGEEMYQQLDFYERSLKAVERDDFYVP